MAPGLVKSLPCRECWKSHLRQGAYGNAHHLQPTLRAETRVGTVKTGALVIISLHWLHSNGLFQRSHGPLHSRSTAMVCFNTGWSGERLKRTLCMDGPLVEIGHGLSLLKIGLAVACSLLFR